MDDFRGRVAVITGGGSGLGAETSRAFAREGAIVLADVDEEGMETVRAELAAAGAEALSVRTERAERLRRAPGKSATA